MIVYMLQVWDKNKRKYIATWNGKDFGLAKIMAKKPYNSYPWMGKKRILSISTQVTLELQHIGRK